MEYKIKANKQLRIAISGKSGCGNTTVSTLLAKKLNMQLINFTFRQLAEERGITLAEVIENAKNDSSYDKIVDQRQIELAKKDSCVLASRLAIWMLKEADLKVYLEADKEIRAKRILKREGGDLIQIEKFTQMRDAEDTSRYINLYGIDNNDFGFADIKIDTAVITPEKIVDIILNELLTRGLIESE